jgi:SAM-dependent methyltransferase
VFSTTIVNDYIFSTQTEDRERRRLRLVEAAIDPMSHRALERAGIRDSQHCLDAGAGAGSILRWMGERVGRNGIAVGVDVSTRYLSDFTDPPYRIVESDLLSLSDEFSFDLIHCRYVLIHNLASERILDSLWKMLNPGGYLVCIEPDFTTARDLSVRPSRPGSVNEAICAMFEAKGLDPEYGNRLPQAFAERELTVASVEARSHLCRGGETLAVMMGESAQALSDAYEATGKADSEDIRRYIDNASDPSHWATYYTSVAVVGRKD